MAASGTSFQKKSRGKIVNICGTRASLHNNQLLISTGIPSLDNCIGGGLAVGTVVLIEEDSYGSYSRLMLKYFLAEGVMNKHELFLSSGDVSPNQILSELPGPIIDDPGPEPVGMESQEMKIAWRYHHLPQMQSAAGAGGLKFGHYYDLTKNMDPEMLQNAQKTLHNPDDTSMGWKWDGSGLMNASYADLLIQIQARIQAGAFSTQTAPAAQQRNILRIGIHSLGSPQWGEQSGPEGRTDPSLCRFLYALRVLMRSAYAVCLITMPTHLFKDVPAFIKRQEHLCDTVFRLDSFVGTEAETNPAYKDYHGLFHLVKLPRLNSLSCHMPDTLDLAFKLRRKKFMIEKLHLPPDLSDTASRAQEDQLVPKSVGCASTTGNSKLDF